MTVAADNFFGASSTPQPAAAPSADDFFGESPATPVTPASSVPPQTSGGISPEEAKQAEQEDWREGPSKPVLASAALGAAKSVFEAKDFFSGGAPDFADKSAVRKWIEERDADLSKDSVLNGLASSAAQFGVGFVGLGKIKYVAQGLEYASKIGTGARFAAESARGAAAGGIFMDPHQDRLSNLVEAYPSLSNPITNYLASRPEDGEAEGRLKNALEGIVMDVTLAGAITLVSKSIKFAKAGKLDEANVAASAADAAFERAANRPISEEAQLRADESGANGASPPGGSADDGASNLGGGTSRVPSADGGGTGVARGVPDSGPHAVVGGDGPSGESVGNRSPQVAPEEVNTSLNRLAKDNQALAAHGSWDAAVAAGYKFKPQREGSGVIPWQKLNTTEETQAWMGQIIDDQAKFINERRGGNAEGVLTDPAVHQMLAARVAQWGDDPAALVGALKAAGDNAPEMVANMETSFLLANRAFQDAFELAQRIKSDNFEGFGSRVEALAALQNRMAQATGMYANGKAIVTNSARALRRMRGEFKIGDEQLANIKNSDPEALLNLVNDTGGNPKALANTGKFNMLNRVADTLASYQAANLLWGWKTQVVNFATSSAMLVWRPLETAVGASFLQAGSKITGLGDEAFRAQAAAIRRQSVMETTKLASVTMDGMKAGVKAFVEGDSILLPHNTEQLNVAKSSNLKDIVPDFRPITGMDDVVHNLLESAITLKGAGGALLKAPLRTLGAADEMVKTMRYRAIVSAKATLEAEERGLAAGSPEFKGFVSTKLDSAFDDAGRGLDKQALLEAQTSTFQQDLMSSDMTHLGAMSRNYSAFASQVPAARLLTPFIKTPTNLMRYGVKLTPGINLLQKEYWHAVTGQAGVEAQARATGQMMLGITIAGIATQMWASGTLVGEGPQGVNEKRQWMAQGNRANSIVWRDKDGVKQSMELGRFDPVTMPLILVANVLSTFTQNHLREEEEAGLGMSVVLSLAHLTKDKTYLKNLSDALDAFTDDQKMKAWPKRFAPGLLPFSSLMPMVNPDPYQHELRGVMDALMAKTPGLSASVPPQRDIFGDRVLAPTGFTASQRNAGPLAETLDQIFATTGHFLNPPAPKSNGGTGGVDLRDFTLKANGRNAYDLYQEMAGHPEGEPSLKETLTTIVTDPGFKDLPNGLATEPGTKAGELMRPVKMYREAAFKRMLFEHEDLREAVLKRRMEIAGADMKRPVEATGAIAGVKSLLKSFGLTQ